MSESEKCLSEQDMAQIAFQNSWRDVAMLAVKFLGIAAIVWPLAWCGVQSENARYEYLAKDRDMAVEQ